LESDTNLDYLHFRSLFKRRREFLAGSEQLLIFDLQAW
jgi:hypothetical protein